MQNIFLGQGPTKVLIWSSMHGNEQTCNRVVVELMEYIKNNQEFLDKITFCIIPILNEYGFEHFVRENEDGIDINRDAIELKTKQANFLRQTILSFRPDYAFNMHDMEMYYMVDGSKNQSFMALYAPPFDEKFSINPSRKKAIKLISSNYNFLNTICPNHIARYMDDFTPSAFGEFCASNNISTILVECGANAFDINRDSIKEICLKSMIKFLEDIINLDFSKIDLDTYNNMPNNLKNRFYDIIIKDFEIFGQKINLGIRRKKTYPFDFADKNKDFEIEIIKDIDKVNCFELR